MKIFTITALSLMFTLLFGTDVFSQSWSTYNSKNNPRAQGVTLSVDYPSDYQLGLDSPNQIIAYFVSSDYYSNVAKILQIMIVGDPSAIEDRATRESFENDDEYDLCSMPESELRGSIFRLQGKNGLSINPNYQKKSVNGLCGIIYTGTITFSQQGIPLYTVLDAFAFGYMNKTVRQSRYVLLTCNTTGLMAEKNIIQSVHLTDSNGLCNQYFNSLQIYDR
ncbi:MAG: hypothetical protein LBD17_01730 [Endomicrobium sp.]|jgi:hypothetical protein|nr:hypothetical protein [Endomicrobium sp.]